MARRRSLLSDRLPVVLRLLVLLLLLLLRVVDVGRPLHISAAGGKQSHTALLADAKCLRQRQHSGRANVERHGAGRTRRHCSGGATHSSSYITNVHTGRGAEKRRGEEGKRIVRSNSIRVEGTPTCHSSSRVMMQQTTEQLMKDKPAILSEKSELEKVSKLELSAARTKFERRVEN